MGLTEMNLCRESTKAFLNKMTDEERAAYDQEFEQEYENAQKTGIFHAAGQKLIKEKKLSEDLKNGAAVITDFHADNMAFEKHHKQLIAGEYDEK